MIIVEGRIGRQMTLKAKAPNLRQLKRDIEKYKLRYDPMSYGTIFTGRPAWKKDLKAFVQYGRRHINGD